jgi:5-methyltetrahydrofolate--homocysteine methyltransferase
MRGVLEGNVDATTDGVRAALADDVPAETVLKEALIPGMEKAGDLFARGEYFVPELLFAARAMSAAVEAMRPQLVKGGYEPAGKVVMGTVQGDMHDIGKKLVSMMMEGCGFEVVDLGTDVSPERFVEAVKESGARLVGLSTLLTTTLPAMETTIRALRQAKLSDAVQVLVGGAPVTETYAQQIGADGYAPDASAAAALARQLIGLPVQQSGGV